MSHPTYDGAAAGFFCTSTYFGANVPVVATISNSITSHVSVNDTAFVATKQEMHSGFLNSQAFEGLFLNETGSNHLQYYIYSPESYPIWEGPILALGAKYNLSIESMLSAPDLLERAQEIKQVFFGKTMLTIFSDLAQSNLLVTTPVSTLLIKSRLVVVFGFGITIGALLSSLGIASITILWLTRLGKRPLQLEHDPNTAMAIALLLNGTETANCFADLDRAPTHHMETLLGSCVFFVSKGKLHRAANSPPASSIQSSSQAVQKSKIRRIARRLGISEASHFGEDWRPFGLRFLFVSMLVLLLMFVIAGLVTVYVLSRGRGLYESAFTFQDTISIRGHYVAALTPISVVPRCLLQS